MSLNLPVDGQTNWGDQLNAAVSQADADALSVATGLASHAANSPSDPHGDRAFAQNLVSPIITGTNQPNGYVKLNSGGAIPANLITGTGGAGGLFNAVVDAVATYGATPGTGADQSVKIQNALNAVKSAGGGICYIGPGTFSLSNYLVIGSNTWLMMSEGTTLQRISGSPTPAYLISNVQFGTTNSQGTNVRISGGTLDAVGSGLTTACTPIFLIQGHHSIVEDVQINNVWGNPAIELNGCVNVTLDSIEMDGTNKNTGGSSTKPAIRINGSDATTTPSGLAPGLYNDLMCRSLSITNCRVNIKTDNWGPYSSLIATDLAVPGGRTYSNITISGCIMPYVDNSSVRYSIGTNGQWIDYDVTNNVLPEFGWQLQSLNHGWSNTNLGPKFQWRYVNFPGGVQSVPAFANTLEFIGDISAGTVANDTIIATLPSLFTVNNNQVLVVQFPTAASFDANAHLYFNAADNTVRCSQMTSSGGDRLFVHGFISMEA